MAQKLLGLIGQPIKVDVFVIGEVTDALYDSEKEMISFSYKWFDADMIGELWCLQKAIKRDKTPERPA